LNWLTEPSDLPPLVYKSQEGDTDLEYVVLSWWDYLFSPDSVTGVYLELTKSGHIVTPIGRILIVEYIPEFDEVEEEDERPKIIGHAYGPTSE